MFGWFTGLGIWIKVAIIAALLGLVVGAVWYIHHSIWKDGYVAAEVVYKPQVAKLQQDVKDAQADTAKAVAINVTFKAENDRLAGQVKEQAASISQFEADAITAQNKARAAMAQVIREQATNTRNRAEIKRLQDIVNGPPLTEKDCEEADNILRTLLRDGVSVGAGAATTPSK